MLNAISVRHLLHYLFMMHKLGLIFLNNKVESVQETWRLVRLLGLFI